MMEPLISKTGRERVDSVITAEDMHDVSPVSPVSFDHALEQLELDLGLTQSPSRNVSHVYSLDERPQGAYGPVATTFFTNPPSWTSPRTMRHSVAAAGMPPLIHSPPLAPKQPRLSVDGANLELMSDFTSSKLNTPIRRSTLSPIEQHPASPTTGNMTGLQRSRRANFSRPAPRRLAQRRDSDSLSPIRSSGSSGSSGSDPASPRTPEAPFHFLEPLHTSPQQLPRLVIPSQRKQSSAAAGETGYVPPPPIPEYSQHRPRRLSSVSASLDDPEQRAARQTVLTVSLPSMSPIALPRLHELQAASAGVEDAVADSPTIPEALHSLMNSPVSLRKRSQVDKPLPAPPAASSLNATMPAREQQDHEPFIVSSSPTQDVFFTISDYYNDDSPYDTIAHNNALHFYLSPHQQKPSMPLRHPAMVAHQPATSPTSASPTNTSNSPQDTALTLRDQVQRILRRSDSQRLSTAAWSTQHRSSSSSSSSSFSTMSSIGASSTDTSASARSSTSSISPSIGEDVLLLKHAARGASEVVLPLAAY